MLILFTVVVFLASCGCAFTQTGLSAADQRELLNAHNNLRAGVSPIATNMKKMVWNSELAAVAQSYAKKCLYAHNSDRSKQSPSFTYVGENLAITTARGTDYTALVQMWYNEVANYKYGSNTCTGVCGHYTQTVWATSSEVGCGAYRCASGAVNFKYKNALILVCDYGPGGNYVGMKPYKTGASSCSACPSDAPHCVGKLCSSTKGLYTNFLYGAKEQIWVPREAATPEQAEFVDDEDYDDDYY